MTWQDQDKKPDIVDQPRRQADICLVAMPLAAVVRPSIALGTLKAILRRDGLDAKVLYPSNWFLEYFGFTSYVPLYEVRPQEVVVDWLFAGVAFPDFEPDHERYLERLIARSGIKQPSNWSSPEAWLLDLRGQMPRFVDWVAEKVLALEPRLVGCTSMFQQHVASLALLRRLRELNPSICTVIGGANCETVMGRTTHQNFPWVDYVVSGEADSLVTELFKSILESGRDIAAEDLPNGVLGPVHREMGYPEISGGDGVPRAVVASLTDLPPPDYDEFFDELQGSLYRSAILPGLPMETSRGCWWGQKQHCTFCGLNGGGMSFRSKQPDQVLAEIDSLVGRYGLDKIETVDNILDMSYFETVLPRLAAQQRDLLIFFETKSNLKLRQVELLADSGVRWIQPGIESLHSEILKLMRKGVGAWKNVQLLKWCRQHGIRVSWSLLSGFPGEKDEWYAEMAAWMPLLSHLQAGALNPLCYERYSPYFTRPDDYGLALKPSYLYQYAYPLTEDQLMDQVYFFVDEHSPDDGRPLLSLPAADRPGFEATRLAMRAWIEAWQEKPYPVLTLCDVDDGKVIADTRACAVARRQRLSDLHYAIIDQSDAAPVPERLRTAVSRRMTVSDQAFDSALAELIDRKLVVQLDGRILSLVLTAPVARLLSRAQFPGGFMLKDSVARFWQSDAEDVVQAAE